MRELSLFTGIGGGIYGSLILGWQTVAYVEKDEYPRRVIEQRIKDGWFDKGEIYADIKDFNNGPVYGYAGKIDIITGGFPCQPHSVAGKRKGTSDERYLWDEIEKTISVIRPGRLFFENVRGILTDRAIIDVCKRIESLGYAIKPPLLLSSFDCGNIHKRDRVWFYAFNTSSTRNIPRSGEISETYGKIPERDESAIINNTASYDDKVCEQDRKTIYIADTAQQQLDEARFETAVDSEQQEQEFGDGFEPGIASDTGGERVQGRRKKKMEGKPRLSRRESIRSIEDLLRRSDVPPPLFRGVDDELPNWRKQLKAVGNGQDPIVMATAYKLLENF